MPSRRRISKAHASVHQRLRGRAINGSLTDVELSKLMAKGANVDAQDSGGSTPLLSATS